MTHDGFLEAIRAQPDDDAPRLIYADWLEEQGQPERAEFIRVQCEKERVPEDSPRWFDLTIRERELRDMHEREWLGACSEILCLGPCPEILRRCHFRRGFPDSIRLDAHQFLDRGEEIFRLGPIREIRLEKSGGLLHSLAASSFLNRVLSLSLAAEKLCSEDVRVLCGSPHFTGLIELDLSLNRLDSEACAFLRDATFFAQLRSLNLSSNSDIGPTGVEFLAGSRKPVQMTDLNLGWCRLGSAGIQALASERAFYHKLTRLDVAGNEASAAGMRALAHAGGSLRALDIGWQDIGIDGVRELAGSEAFSSLAELGLGNSALGSEGAVLLAQSPHLCSLARLYVHENNIGARGAKELAASTVLSRLEILALDDNEVGDEGAKSLANSPYLTNLKRLSLTANGLSPWGIRELVMSPALENLYTLDLSSSRLSDPEAQVIARWSRLRQLTKLFLHNNRIGDLGAKELAESPHLPCLRHLELHRNRITAEGVSALKSSGLQDRLFVLSLSDNPIIEEVVGFLPPSNK